MKRISFLFICLFFVSVVQAQSKNDFRKYLQNLPFTFNIKKIGTLLGTLNLLDAKDDTLDSWESCSIINAKNEVLVCNFVPGGGKHQIFSFKLFNAKSIAKHSKYSGIDSTYLVASQYSTVITSKLDSFIYDHNSGLNATYADIVQTYGEPDGGRVKGDYKVIVYMFGKRPFYKYLYYQDYSYYSFEFYGEELIEVNISCGDF